MSIDEYANTQCVVCEHCSSELRVWYTPNPHTAAQQEAGCPACRKGVSLDIRAKIESVEVIPPENCFGSRKSSDKSRLSPEANKGLVSEFMRRFRREDRE
jgi:hypothetical protein